MDNLRGGPVEKRRDSTLESLLPARRAIPRQRPVGHFLSDNVVAHPPPPNMELDDRRSAEIIFRGPGHMDACRPLWAARLGETDQRPGLHALRLQRSVAQSSADQRLGP